MGTSIQNTVEQLCVALLNAANLSFIFLAGFKNIVLNI